MNINNNNEPSEETTGFFPDITSPIDFQYVDYDKVAEEAAEMEKKNDQEKNVRTYSGLMPLELWRYVEYEYLWWNSIPNLNKINLYK